MCNVFLNAGALASVFRQTFEGCSLCSGLEDLFVLERALQRRLHLHGAELRDGEVEVLRAFSSQRVSRQLPDLTPGALGGVLTADG